MMPEEHEEIKSSCRNCEQEVKPYEKFCPHCGQENKPLKLTVVELLGSFWSSLLNVDNTTFKTLRKFWKSWELTKLYIEGKRKSYLSPVRIFIVCLVLYLTLLSANLNLDRSRNSNFYEVSKVERSRMLEDFDRLAECREDSTVIKPFADSLRKEFFADVKPPAEDFYFDNFAIEWGDFEILNRIVGYKVTRADAMEMSPQEIIEKYNVEKFWDKIIMKQYLRLNSDRIGFVKFIIKNLLWAILLALIFQAFFMKLIYIRRKRFLVEHLVFLLNLHSFLFFATSVYLIFTIWRDDAGSWSLLVMGAALVYFYIALYKYYRQGMFKTFVKYGLILGFHSFLLFFTPLLITFLSLFLF